MYYFIVFNLKALLFLYMTQAIHKTWAVFAVTLLISFTYLLIAYKYIKKHKHLIIFILYGLFSVLMFADVLYCLYFNRLLSLSLQSQIKQLPGVTNVIAGIINIWVLLFIIDLPFLLLYFRKRRTFEIQSLHVSRFKTTIAINIFVIVFLLSNHAKTIRAYEFFTYHTVDIVNSMKQEEVDESILTDERIQKLIDASKLKEGPLTGIAKGRNIIIVQVEALQALALNAFIRDQEITPNLNALLKDKGTIYFNDIFQSVARGNTSDAEFATLNSLYPSTKQIVYQESADKNYYSLAHLLTENGYDTAYFHANDGDFYNRKEMTQSLGFNHFYDANRFELKDESEIISYGLNDFSFLRQSLDYISELDASSDLWMSFLITLSSHAPFDLREQDKTLSFDNETNNIALNYFESLHYVDTALGEFIDGLKERGLYDNSILVLYGDHFGLNASVADQKQAIEEVLESEYTIEKMMNIPLMIHIPHEQVNQEIDSIGSQLDIMPTLLNLMGLENKKGVMLGQDLLNSKRYNNVTLQFFLPDGSYMDNQFTYVSSRDLELEHSQLISRDFQDKLDPSLIQHQLELNQEKLELSKQLILQDKIKKSSIED